MKIFYKALLFSALLGTAVSIQAANEGDTQTTRITSCSESSNTCTSTTTTMEFRDGRWVIVSVTTITVPYRRNVEK